MPGRQYLYDDFTATIRILTPEEGGRATPVMNGLRWDFSYANDADATRYMIWPDFCDAHGNSLSGELPVGVALPARMVIVVDDMREWHKSRLQPGTPFHCHEGTTLIATGQVQSITGLLNKRHGKHIR